jgi:hypothetical protein
VHYDGTKNVEQVSVQKGLKEFQRKLAVFVAHYFGRFGGGILGASDLAHVQGFGEKVALRLLLADASFIQKD